MARDGTNRGGRRVRAGDKPMPAVEKIQKGQSVKIMDNDLPTLTPTELDSVDLPEGALLEGLDMPKPSDYLSARQKNGVPLGADEIFKETWLWLKERGCERLVNPRLIEAYAAEHPLCEVCLAAGRYTPAEAVHHIKPLSQGGTHDISNLKAVCKACHARIHGEMGDRWSRKVKDYDHK